MYSLGAMKETTCSNAVGKSFELSYEFVFESSTILSARTYINRCGVEATPYNYRKPALRHMYSLGAMKETTCSNAVGKSFELSYVWPRQHQFFEVGPLRFPGPHFVFDSSFSKYLCPWYTPRIPLHPNLCGSKATMVKCVDAPPPS
jgi:hypothetical protein